MDEPTQKSTREWVRSRLGSLPDGEWIRLGDPVPPPPPRKGLRRPKAPAVRYVMAVNTMGQLQGECVGPASYGGPWDIDAEQHERLVDMGWLSPEQVDRFRNPLSSYCFDAMSDEPERLDRLADLMVGALEVLGLDPETAARELGP